MMDGFHRRAMNLSISMMQELVSIDDTIVMCLALFVKQVKRKHHQLTSGPARGTVRSNKRLYSKRLLIGGDWKIVLSGGRTSLGSLDLPSKLELRGLCRTDCKRPDGVSMIPWEMGKQLSGMSRSWMLLHTVA